MNSDDVFGEQLTAEMVKRTDKILDQNLDMAIRLKQAREFMAWSSHHMRGLWLEWVEESNKVSHELNTFRMAIQRETGAIVAAGKDVKEFFGSPEYAPAHDRLKEMVTLLERFQELKSNGTLDAFADFILKVSCNSPSKT